MERVGGLPGGRSVILVGGILLMTVIMAQVVNRTEPVVALAMVIGMAVLVASFISTEIALYILIFSMLLSPEIGQRGTEGGGTTIRLDDLFLMLISFSWLVRTAIYKELGLFTETKLNKPMFTYIGVCVFATGFGMIAGRVRPLTGFFFVFKFFEYFIVYFMAVNHIHEREQVHRFIIAMIVTWVIVSLLAMAQIPSGERVTAPFEGEGGEPNTLGGYLVLMMSLILGLVFTSNAVPSGKHRVMLLSFVLLALIPFLFTNSRGSWLAAVPMYFAFLFFSEKKALLALGLILMMVLGPFVIPQSVKERAMYTFKKGETVYVRSIQEEVGGVAFDPSASARIRSWKSALRDFKNHPVLGYGVTGWKFLDAQYLRVLIETGLLGLVAFLGLLITLIREVWQIYHNVQDRFFRGIAFGFFVGILAMMVHAISANTFIIVRIMEPFWFLAAIVMMLPVIEKQEQEQHMVSVPSSSEGTSPVG